MELYDRENKNLEKVQEFDLPGSVQDIVSGFYYLRTLDLSKMNKGQNVNIKGFFDKEIYNIKLIYEGQEKIKTDLGEVDTYIFFTTNPQEQTFPWRIPCDCLGDSGSKQNSCEN